MLLAWCRVLLHLHKVIVYIFLGRKIISTGAIGKGGKREGEQGEVDHQDHLHHQVRMYLLLIPLIPLHIFLFLLLYDV